MSLSLGKGSKSFFTLPVFLTPAFSKATHIPCAPSAHRLFGSSSKQSQKKDGRDANRNRGVSAIRSTGPKAPQQFRAIDSWGALPVADPKAHARRAEFEAQYNQDHGLYQFFNAKKEAIIPADEEGAHGRGWTKYELMRKDFFDLWKLHWVCVKEINRVSTRNSERLRMRLGYGRDEAEKRIKVIKTTMRNIRAVLIERHDDEVAARLLLGKVYLAELFPDAEAELGLVEAESPFIQVMEVDDQITAEELDKEVVSSENNLDSVENASPAKTKESHHRGT